MTCPDSPPKTGQPSRLSQPPPSTEEAARELTALLVAESGDELGSTQRDLLLRQLVPDILRDLRIKRTIIEGEEFEVFLAKTLSGITIEGKASAPDLGSALALALLNWWRALSLIYAAAKDTP